MVVGPNSPQATWLAGTSKMKGCSMLQLGKSNMGDFPATLDDSRLSHIYLSAMVSKIQWID